MEETSVLDKHVEEVIHTNDVVDTGIGKQLMDVTETDIVTETKTNRIDQTTSVVTLYKNLIVLGISFLLIFAAFSSLENLQSSLNVAGF